MLAVFTLDKNLSKEEQTLLYRVFGESTAEHAVRFLKEKGLKAVNMQFDKSLSGASMMNLDLREVLCSDLTHAASLAGGAESERLHWIETVQKRLAIDRPVKLSNDLDTGSWVAGSFK